MLRTLEHLERMAIGAVDGPIGKVKDAYFEDRNWTVRYLVVDTGGWLSRKVLVTPLSIQGADWDAHRIDVSMTREQVRHSPDIDADKPVSRQHEMAYLSYYGLPYYWGGPMLWGPSEYPSDVGELSRERLRTEPSLEESQSSSEHGDPRLRSCRTVAGYHIEATDGPIGHVEDYLLDDRTWSIVYIAVETRNWLPGQHVLVSTEHVRRVSWEERKIYLALSKAEVRRCPPFDRDLGLSDLEERAAHEQYPHPDPHRFSNTTFR